MKYEELNNKAKERAREQAAEWQTDTVWWEHVYEDAATVGALMGIDIGIIVARTAGDASMKEYDISFSGFCSQGDGACWSGWVRTIEFVGAVERVKAHCGSDEDIWAIAEQAEVINKMLVVHHVITQLSGDAEDGPYRECVPDMTLTVKGWDRVYSTCLSTDTELTDEAEYAINKFVEDFAGWIYDQLKKEHDHLTSDENIESLLAEGDHEFDEDGYPWQVPVGYTVASQPLKENHAHSPPLGNDRYP